MMTPRLRRLIADHRLMVATFTSHPYIRLVMAEGNPPERYVVQFSVTSLVADAANGAVQGNEHQAEFLLNLDYPRRPPLCRMLTPVFHPNIDPQKICIGDHWNAGQSLVEIVIRIGEMLTYQSYNVKSPLNAKAAAWAEQNTANLPLQKVDLSIGVAETGTRG